MPFCAYMNSMIDLCLRFCSRLIRIFDFVFDTPARQTANKFAFALDLFVSLHIKMNRLIDMERITLKDIDRSDDIMLDRVRGLYETSFPEEERRPWRSILDMIDSRSPFFRMRVILSDEKKFLGFLTTWNLPSTLYIEHFAVEKAARGSGIGSLVLSALKVSEAETPIVLEVELPGDSPEAERRIAFYERNGFEAMRDYPYYQPPYRPDLESVPMMLMTTSPLPDANSFVIMLHTLVYNQ